jgi:DNA-binding transcriptional regulator YdaS (Cro superfamily)
MRKTTTAGEYLAICLDRNGIERVELARSIGLQSGANVSDWINGSRQIPLHHLPAVAKYSGANLATLRSKVLLSARTRKPAKAVKTVKVSKSKKNGVEKITVPTSRGQLELTLVVK